MNHHQVFPVLLILLWPFLKILRLLPSVFLLSEMKKVLYSLLTIFFASCSYKEPITNPTDRFLPGEKLAELKNKKMREISGIASSINNPKLLWSHNDSGNDAEIFLVDENLNVKLTCELKGVVNRDWEDIAVGPGPDSSKNYIYIADIGDNDTQYQYKYIYRFEEPRWTQGQEKKNHHFYI